MTRRRDTKARVRTTAAELFRRQGYHGTGMNQILGESGAPAGSVYFHFPGGKAELAIESVTAAGNEIGRGIEYLLEANDDIADALGAVLDYLARDLRESDYAHGCPVGTVALDVASTSEPIRLACRTVFDDWTATIERRLRAAGWRKKAASDEALVIIALIEGALLLARARRDTEPLTAVARHVRGTLAGPAASGSRAPRR
jgi:TetR/AcrR family transcriptional regulator, lmrAB and yxaGH operons repressor